MPRRPPLFRLFVGMVVVYGLSFVAPTAAQYDREAAPVVEQAAVDPPAHINFVDGTAVLERDGKPDTAPLNMPVLAGDRIRTEAGRVEILYGDGSTLHLDLHTSVDFQSDELIRLRQGRVRLAIPGPNRAVSYRIDAAAAYADLLQPGDYRVSLLREREEELELAVLRGAADLVNDAGRTALRAGERALARANAAPSYAFAFNSAQWDGFDRWSETRRDARIGASAQYLPDEVRPYSASFDQYGSWRYDSSYGQVWYPTVSVGWRPYYYGRWATLPAYGWTWVGSDPWAWPTHHYGRWGFSAGLWFWIPGRYWAPAWVSWAYAPGYVSWCPLGFNNRPIFNVVGYSRYGYGYNPWRGWTVVPRHHFGTGYVHAGAIAGSAIDSRTRGGFAYGTAAPNRGGVAVPRSSTPIRIAGTAVPRSSPTTSFRAANGTQVYTNLPRSESRVGGSPSYVGSASPRDPRRTSDAPDTSGGRAQAVPRTPVPGSATPVGPATRATDGGAPQPYGRYGAIERAPARTPSPRDDRSSGVPSRAPGGIAADRGAAPGERTPVDRGSPRAGEVTAPRGPEMAAPGGPGSRAVPRGYESAPPPSSRPSAGIERRAPDAPRSAPPPSAAPPSAAPRSGSEPRSSAPPPSRQAPPAGGQPSGGRGRGRG